MAMVLSEFVRRVDGFRFSILATDISTQVLEKAQLGVYLADEVEPVSGALKKRYLLKRRKPGCNQVRVAPSVYRKR